LGDPGKRFEQDIRRDNDEAGRSQKNPLLVVFNVVSRVEIIIDPPEGIENVGMVPRAEERPMRAAQEMEKSAQVLRFRKRNFATLIGRETGGAD
jgi:hypothetical protein